MMGRIFDEFFLLVRIGLVVWLLFLANALSWNKQPLPDFVCRGICGG